MHRAKRRVSFRCQSTPTQQVRPSGNVDVHRQQSEPIAGIESSFRDEVEINSSPHLEPIVAEGSSVALRKAPTYWIVEVINDTGHKFETRLWVQDLFETRRTEKVITSWNSEFQPVGDSAALLASFLGEVGGNFNNFPIMYENWKKVPGKTKDKIYCDKIQANFVVDDGEHKKYILRSLSKKWRDKRCRLFGKYYNWELSLEDNIRNCPPHISEDHWAVFLHYRLSTKTMDISLKNATNHEKLVIPHTLGSKTLARKRNELV